MGTFIMLALAVTAHGSAERHVRATEPRILALISTGLARSATFRTLITTLDASDVIVYVEPKLLRRGLGGFLAHHVVVAGGYRYLHVEIDHQGADGRVVALLAHELQHAVEVSQSPETRDAADMERMFKRISIEFGCNGSTTCTETQGALDVEFAVREELTGPRK